MENSLMTPNRLPFYGQFIERFNFWGLQSILVLYLTVAKQLPESIAFQDYGFFTGCAFVLALFGGILADKFIGFRATIICGIGLACLGNIILAFGYTALLIFGLMSIALGAGLFISTNPVVLALEQPLYPIRRLNNITVLYLVENCAFISGSFGYGLIWNTFGVKYCFILSACLLAIYLITVLRFAIPKQNRVFSSAIPEKIIKATMGIFIALIILTLLIQFTSLENTFIVFVAISTFVYLIWTVTYVSSIERPALIALLIIFSTCLIFFTVLFQMNSSLLMFIQTHVQKSLFNLNIPASAFAASESLFAILWAPIFSVMWTVFNQKMRISTEIRKVALSLLLQSIGFFIFIHAMHLAILQPGGVSPWAVLPGYVFLGAGDICLIPTVINAVTVWAPPQHRGIFMGIFYVIIGFSGVLAGNLAALSISAKNSANPLFDTIFVYHQLNHFAFIAAFVALSLSLL